jgi:hypothetical protein
VDGAVCKSRETVDFRCSGLMAEKAKIDAANAFFG